MTSPELKIEYLPVAGLVPYARNARTHSPAQVSQLAASIREFGFTNPVLVDPDGGIVAGHGRVLAAIEAGLGQVPTLRLGWLTDAQRRAYVLADNRLALDAGWDEGLLRLELADLAAGGFDLGLIGFAPGELNDLIGTPNAVALDSSPQLTEGFKFSVLVAAVDEADQARLVERFEEEGLQCRPLISQ